MSTFVVLAAVGAVVGAMGLLLTSAVGRRRSRHRGGAAVLPRVGAAVLALALAAGLLVPFADTVELAMSGIVLLWASLPWLALTTRMGSWAHACWTHAANAAAGGLLYLAWQTLTHERPMLMALGVWVLWALAAAAAVLLLAYVRRAAIEPGGRTVPRPALSTVWAAGSAAAVVLAFTSQAGPLGAPSEATGRMVPGATGTSSVSSGAATTAATRPSPTGTSSPAATAQPVARAVTTTRAARSAQRPTRLPAPVTTTQPTTSATTTPTTATSSPTSSALDIKVLPTPPNRPHTPPGHR